MENSRLVQEFLNYLNFERRFSEHTAKCYGADLCQFGEYLVNCSEDNSSIGMESSVYGGQQVENSAALATQTGVKIDQILLAASANDIRAYMANLNEQQYSKSTIARKVATLRSLNFSGCCLIYGVTCSRHAGLSSSCHACLKAPKFMSSTSRPRGKVGIRVLLT